MMFTYAKAGSGLTRRGSAAQVRYFLVLAGRRGVFYDQSGPTFPILVKMEGHRTQVDAVGIYAAGGKRLFGRVPASAYRRMMKDPPPEERDSEVRLRLEITGAQYERSLKILRTWERRTEEGALL